MSGYRIQTKLSGHLLLSGVFLVGFSLSLFLLHYGRLFRIQSAIDRWSATSDSIRRGESAIRWSSARSQDIGSLYYPGTEESQMFSSVCRSLRYTRDGELRDMYYQRDALEGDLIRLMNLTAIAICGSFGTVSVFAGMILRSRICRGELPKTLRRRAATFVLLACVLSGAVTIAEVEPCRVVPRAPFRPVWEAATLLKIHTSIPENEVFKSEEWLGKLAAADMCLSVMYGEIDYLPLRVRLRVEGEIRGYCENTAKPAGADENEYVQARIRGISEVASRMAAIVKPYTHLR